MTRKYPRRLQKILEHLGSHPLERVYLFGSWARGEGDELSDLDVVVIMDSEKPFMERMTDLAVSLPARLGGVDLFVYTPEEFRGMLRDGNAFAEMIVEEGMLVYERD